MRAIDDTLLRALSTIARIQSAPTELTRKWVDQVQVLDYVATYQNAKIIYHASDMWLLIHINASYLNDHNAKSDNGNICFLGWYQPDNAPLRLNVCLLPAVGLLKLVASSTACSVMHKTEPSSTLLSMRWVTRKQRPLQSMWTI